MINACQAAHISQAFDKEANYKKSHDACIRSIDCVVRSHAERGGTMVQWVPTIGEVLPKIVHDKVLDTLKAEGFIVQIDSANIWNIFWEVSAP